ncbi:MAG: hypothetical protein AAF329_00440 [Cyanobacteria bacterium P01_A01_bin.17]
MLKFGWGWLWQVPFCWLRFWAIAKGGGMEARYKAYGLGLLSTLLLAGASVGHLHPEFEMNDGQSTHSLTVAKANGSGIAEVRGVGLAWIKLPLSLLAVLVGGAALKYSKLAEDQESHWVKLAQVRQRFEIQDYEAQLKAENDARQAEHVLNADNASAQRVRVAAAMGVTQSGFALPPSELVAEAVNEADQVAVDSTTQELKNLAAHPQNLLVIAVGGGGKGVVLSNLARFRVESDPKYVTFWIDPKNSRAETGYFNHPNILAYRFTAAECSPAQIVDHMKRALSIYKSACAKLPARTPIMLVLDEWYFIKATLAEDDSDALSTIENAIRGAISLLDEHHRHITLVTQSPNQGDIIEGGGGMLANFSTIALFKREERSFKMLGKCNQCGTVPRKAVIPTDLFPTCDRSPRNRAIYINGELKPMPELENYSGYDRDNRAEIETPKKFEHYKNLAELGESQI